ncbi:MAG TPA: ABC transporter permease [Clostridiaceae bacterium]|nr:ABC transporter permease [Clostridiaceae bacterium]
MKSLKALLVNLKIYYVMTFRNTFLFIAHYLLPILFYLLFSVVFVGINAANKLTIIMTMTAFAVAMNSYIGLPGGVVRYAVGDIKRAYIAGGISLWRVFVCAGISNIVHCFITSIVILLTAKPLFDATMPESLLWYFTALLISIVLSTVIGVAIGMFSRIESMATVVSQAIFMPSLFLSGIMIPIEFLPGFLQNITNIIPLKHSFVLLRGYDKQALIISLVFIAVLLILLVIRYRIIIRRE